MLLKLTYWLSLFISDERFAAGVIGTGGVVDGYGAESTACAVISRKEVP